MESRAQEPRYIQHPIVLPDHNGALYLNGGTSESTGAPKRVSTSLPESSVAGAWTSGTGSCCLERLETEVGDEGA